MRAKSFRSLKSRHDAAQSGFIRQSLMKNASFLPSNDKFRSKRQSITIEVKFVWAENNAKSTFVQEGRTNLLSAMKIEITENSPSNELAEWELGFIMRITLKSVKFAL